MSRLENLQIQALHTLNYNHYDWDATEIKRLLDIIKVLEAENKKMLIEVGELRRNVAKKEINVEEEIKDEKDKKESLASSQVLPCFDFYNNLESLNISDL